MWNRKLSNDLLAFPNQCQIFLSTELENLINPVIQKAINKINLFFSKMSFSTFHQNAMMVSFMCDVIVVDGNHGGTILGDHRHF